MIINREKLVQMAIEFDKKCEENDIWYALDDKTLLGAVRHGGFLPWSVKFQVFMTIESFQKLKKIFPSNIIDSSIDYQYTPLHATWVANNLTWQNVQPFIEIRIAVPTTVSKATFYHSYLAYIYRFFHRTRDNIKVAINDLYEGGKFEGYYLVDFRRGKPKERWIQATTFETLRIHDFLGYKFPVIKEYDKTLAYWFGDKYMQDSSIPRHIYEYPAPTLELVVK